MKNLVNEHSNQDSLQDRSILTRNNNCVIDNFSEHAEALEWAGISFGEDQTVLIQKSLKRLARETGASQLKFFGKVFGRSADYWVAQGVLNQVEEAPLSKSQEPRGQGTNATVFWVTNNVMSDWIQLPDAQPEHIVASRHIAFMLTGKLNSELDTNPPFPGKERHYLRAQLARIQHTCEIIPKGLFEIDEET
jgi:radial spoke head protein 4/6